MGRDRIKLAVASFVLVALALGVGLWFGATPPKYRGWIPDGHAPDSFWNGYLGGIEGVAQVIDIHCHGWVTYRLVVYADLPNTELWNPCIVAMNTHDWTQVPGAPGS